LEQRLQAFIDLKNHITSSTIQNYVNLQIIERVLFAINMGLITSSFVIILHPDVVCSGGVKSLRDFSQVMAYYKIIVLLLPLFFLALACISVTTILLIAHLVSPRVHANNDELRSLPTRKCTEVNDDNECIICKEVYRINDDIKILPCKHEYHTDCIDRWLLIKKLCPMCRNPITERANL